MQRAEILTLQTGAFASVIQVHDYGDWYKNINYIPPEMTDLYDVFDNG